MVFQDSLRFYKELHSVSNCGIQGMEPLHPSYLMSNSNWLDQENHNSEWTREENKKFESALAIYDKDTPDLWLKVAAMVPGKTVYDVMKQYRKLEEDVSEIEAGRVPIPGYHSSSSTFDLTDNQNYNAYTKRPATVKDCNQERKKGIPWTEEEHRRFLMGLVKYGKGDWRNISRNFVVTKTPTQVASHAQKYYIRQKLGGGNNKRRHSIHDITIVNHTDKSKPTVFNDSPMLSPQHKLTSTPQVQWNGNHHIAEYGSSMVLNPNPNYDDLFMSSSYVKLQGQDLNDWAFHEALRDFNKEPVYI